MIQPLDYPFGNLAAELLAKRGKLGRLLDIGPGDGTHARYFEAEGAEVTSVGYPHRSGFEPTILGDYTFTVFDKPFNTIWASHVLEHHPNPGDFLRCVYQDLVPGGTAAITVPPPKVELVGGHINLFTLGTLLYHMIIAGFDCSKAACGQYGYNISVVVKKKYAKLPAGLVHDAGDIERLAKFFPFPVAQGLAVFPAVVNWDGVE